MKMKNLLLAASLSIGVFGLNAQPGALDPAYADGAVYRNINLTEGASEATTHMVIDNQDRSWIGGSTLVGGDFKLILVRLTADGMYDAGFNGTGSMIIDLAPNSIEAIQGLALQGDKLIVAGAKTVAGITNQFAIRLTESGSLDPTFGNLGIADLPFNAIVSDVVTDADGMIYISGISDGAVSITKLLPDGAPDLSFSNDGFRIMTLLADSESGSLAVSTEGNVYIFGNQTSGEGLIRASISALSPAGVNIVDFSFTGSKVYPWPNDKDFHLADGLLNADESIFYLVGKAEDSSSNVGVMAVNIDGSVHTEFGLNGFAEYDVTLGGNEQGVEIIEGPNGLYATTIAEESPAGSSSGVINIDFDGNYVQSFGNGGYALYNVSEMANDQALDIDFQSNGDIILLGIADATEDDFYGYASRILVSSVSSIFEKAGPEVLHVYPNPTADIISVDLSQTPSETIEYTIFDIRGVEVGQGVLNAFDKRIDVHDLDQGHYIISLGSFAVARFVKL